MISQKKRRISFTITAAIVSSVAQADIIWPALYVAESHFRFWYVVVIGMLLEFGFLRWRLITDTKKALLVAIIVNALSATVGVYLLIFGMLGWHRIFDNFVNGTFSLINKISTIGLMFIGSTFLEMLIARVIWKYPLRKTLPAFILGNAMSYSVIIIDLFVFGA